MRQFRRKYYDIFSHFYDWIISLHSKDKSLSLRRYLVKKAIDKGDRRALDLCTGTGAVALVLAEDMPEGLVVGLDFSLGMLQKAREKAEARGLKNLFFVAADAGHLPLKPDVFDVVTCSHAIYELTGDTRRLALQEVRRTLRPGGRFCMMEHEVPRSPVTRFLYYIRLLSMGREGRQIVRNELKELGSVFTNVRKEITASGKTKLICAQRP